MRRLLNAEFSRLLKSKIFSICAAVISAYTIFMLIQTESDPGFLNSGVIVTICSAIFSCLFFGDAKDTVRNKIVVGHKKAHIYFTNVIVSCTAALSYRLIYAVPAFIVFLVRGGISDELHSGIGDMLLCGLIETIAIMTMAAIFAFLVTLIRKNVVAVIATALIISGFLLADGELDKEIRVRTSWLNLYDTETGEPLYTGEKREKIQNEISALQSLRIFIPMGQINMAEDSYRNPRSETIYICIGEFLTINAVGAVIYRKKDMK